MHGEAELERAVKASQALFGEQIRELDERTLLDVLSGAPATQRERVSATAGIPLIDLLVDTGLCPSKGQARKDVVAGGVYINNERISDPAAMVTQSRWIAERHVVLRKGKKTTPRQLSVSGLG